MTPREVSLFLVRWCKRGSLGKPSEKPLSIEVEDTTPEALAVTAGLALEDAAQAADILPRRRTIQVRLASRHSSAVPIQRHETRLRALLARAQQRAAALYALRACERKLAQMPGFHGLAAKLRRADAALAIGATLEVQHVLLLTVLGVAGAAGDDEPDGAMTIARAVATLLRAAAPHAEMLRRVAKVFTQIVTQIPSCVLEDGAIWRCARALLLATAYSGGGATGHAGALRGALDGDLVPHERFAAALSALMRDAAEIRARSAAAPRVAPALAATTLLMVRRLFCSLLDLVSAASAVSVLERAMRWKNSAKNVGCQAFHAALLHETVRFAALGDGALLRRAVEKSAPFVRGLFVRGGTQPHAHGAQFPFLFSLFDARSHASAAARALDDGSAAGGHQATVANAANLRRVILCVAPDGAGEQCLRLPLSNWVNSIQARARRKRDAADSVYHTTCLAAAALPLLRRSPVLFEVLALRLSDCALSYADESAAALPAPLLAGLLLYVAYFAIESGKENPDLLGPAECSTRLARVAAARAVQADVLRFFHMVLRDASPVGVVRCQSILLAPGGVLRGALACAGGGPDAHLLEFANEVLSGIGADSDAALVEASLPAIVQLLAVARRAPTAHETNIILAAALRPSFRPEPLTALFERNTDTARAFIENILPALVAGGSRGAAALDALTLQALFVMITTALEFPAILVARAMSLLRDAPPAAFLVSRTLAQRNERGAFQTMCDVLVAAHTLVRMHPDTTRLALQAATRALQAALDRDSAASLNALLFISLAPRSLDRDAEREELAGKVEAAELGPQAKLFAALCGPRRCAEGEPHALLPLLKMPQALEDLVRLSAVFAAAADLPDFRIPTSLASTTLRLLALLAGTARDVMLKRLAFNEVGVLGPSPLPSLFVSRAALQKREQTAGAALLSEAARLLVQFCHELQERICTPAGSFGEQLVAMLALTVPAARKRPPQSPLQLRAVQTPLIVAARAVLESLFQAARVVTAALEDSGLDGVPQFMENIGRTCNALRQTKAVAHGLAGLLRTGGREVWDTLARGLAVAIAGCFFFGTEEGRMLNLDVDSYQYLHSPELAFDAGAAVSDPPQLVVSSPLLTGLRSDEVAETDSPAAALRLCARAASAIPGFETPTLQRFVSFVRHLSEFPGVPVAGSAFGVILEHARVAWR